MRDKYMSFKQNKIVFVVNSLARGGAERVLVTLLNKLIETQECFVILIEDIIDYEIDERIKIIQLNENPNANGLVKLFKLPILAFRLSRIIKKYKFTNVFSLLTRANYINIISNIFQTHKIIISEHSFLSHQYGYRDMKSFINKLLVTSLYKFADKIITVSKSSQYDMKKNFNIHNTKVIYNPIDLELIQKQRSKTIDIDLTKFTFVTIGRLDEGKNHKLIIDSIKDIDVNLLIIGDGILRKDLEEYVIKLKLENRVFLLGEQANPFKYLSNADCFVFGSNHEALPMVILEALACSLPIISTDCQSGPREILAPNSDITFQLKDKIALAEYGIFTPVKNIEKMKEAMNLIIDDESLRKNYQDKAKLRANDFRIDKIIKQYEEIICAE
jgi:glycosyltransferase involved in cell wall biosynthesis